METSKTCRSWHDCKAFILNKELMTALHRFRHSKKESFNVELETGAAKQKQYFDYHLTNLLKNMDCQTIQSY